MIKQLLRNAINTTIPSKQLMVIDITQEELSGSIVEIKADKVIYLAGAKVATNSFIATQAKVNKNQLASSIANLINKCETDAGVTIKGLIFTAPLTTIKDTKQLLEQSNQQNIINIISVEKDFIDKLLEVTNYLNLDLLGIVHLPLAVQQLLQLQDCFHLHIGYSNSWLCDINNSVNEHCSIPTGINNILEKALNEIDINGNLSWLQRYLLTTKDDLKGKIIEQNGIKVSYSQLEEVINKTFNQFVENIFKLGKDFDSINKNIVVTTDNINMINLSKILNYYFYNGVYNTLTKNNFSIETISALSAAHYYVNNHKAKNSNKVFKNNIGKIKQ